MRAVDDHAEPVAFADDRAAEGVETVVARRVGGGVDPVQRFVVAGDQHARAGRMPDAQRRERIFQPDAAFDDDVGSDLAGGACALEIVGERGGVEHVGVRRLDAQDGVDLFERRARGMRGAGRLEGGPELRADTALAQAGNVGVAALVHAGEVIGEDVARRGASCRMTQGRSLCPSKIGARSKVAERPRQPDPESSIAPRASCCLGRRSKALIRPRARGR